MEQVRSFIAIGLPDVVDYNEEESSFFIPDRMLRAPELLIPKRKPVGPVEIDWENPITSGLEVVTLFNGNETPINLVDGQPWTASTTPPSGREGTAWFDEAATYYTLPNLIKGNNVSVACAPKFDDNSGTAYQYFYSWGTWDSN